MFPSSRPLSIVYSVTFADTLAISIFSLVSAFLNKMLNPVSLLLLSFQRSNTLVFPILSMVMSDGACTLADCSSPSLSLEQAPKAHVNNIAINIICFIILYYLLFDYKTVYLLILTASSALTVICFLLGSVTLCSCSLMFTIRYTCSPDTLAHSAANTTGVIS